MTRARPRNQKLIIRKARMEDAGRIAELSTQLGYPASRKAIEARLPSLLNDAGHALLVGEISSGKVVGWVHTFVKRLVESGPHAEIGGLVVDGGFRGRGIGRLLLQRAEQWARRKDLKSVYLRSNVIRNDAHAFYERVGYKNVKTQHTYVKVL